jgi:hypothetical protein
VQELAMSNPSALINRVLLPGTPLAIAKHDLHCQLLEVLSQCLGVHPRNLLFKGSTKLGFSIAPRHQKLWMSFGPASDLDLAIVDSNFFVRLDDQVRNWERDPNNKEQMLRERKEKYQYQKRVRQKGAFDCYRFFDLPRVPLLEELNAHLDEIRTETFCGIPRSLTAFVFRDWWGVFRRYEFDLEELCRGLRNPSNPLPNADEVPRPFAEPMA